MLIQYEKDIKNISPDVFLLDLPCKRKQSKFIIMMKILRASRYKLFMMLKLCPKKFIYK